MNNIESNRGEIVMYQPDETIRLEVRMENEMAGSMELTLSILNKMYFSTSDETTGASF